MEITSENHICNSAENIYDPLTRGKKVEMKARSLIEQRRLGTRRAQPYLIFVIFYTGKIFGG